MSLTLSINQDTSIATVALDRGDVHNAFNDDLINQLHTCFTDLASNDDVKAVILKGNGKSFSAGADLNWMKAAASYSEAENKADALRLSGMLKALNDSPKPVIAVTQGAAMGGGVGLLSCADCVIAIEGCKFALSEVRLGLTPATISPFVINAIGSRWARRLFTTAERFSTDLAEKIGLVHEVYPDYETAMAHAEKLANMIASNAPMAVADAKSLVLDLGGKDITDSLREDTANRIAARRASPEGKEGLTAFLEKRSPIWPKTINTNDNA